MQWQQFFSWLVWFKTVFHLLSFSQEQGGQMRLLHNSLTLCLTFRCSGQRWEVRDCLQHTTDQSGQSVGLNQAAEPSSSIRVSARVRFLIPNTKLLACFLWLWWMLAFSFGLQLPLQPAINFQNIYHGRKFPWDHLSTASKFNSNSIV